MPLKLANNAVSRLSASLAAAATSMSVMPGDGAKFPALAAGDWFPLTLVKSDGSMEIVRCTARATDTFTITRAQEGTAGTAFSAGDRVELRITKAVMDEFALLDSPTFTGEPTAPTPSASDSSAKVQTTAGSLGQMQGFGLGANTGATVSDLDALRASGFYYANAAASAAAGLPLSTLGHTIIHSAGSTGAAQQFASPTTAGVSNRRRLWHRQMIANGWSAWRELAFLDDPAFTGTPTAPTAAAGTNTTQVATTAFVKAAVDAGATPDASTTVKGKVELATGAEAAAGTDATLAITPSTLRSGLNASGSAPVYACRAWVNFGAAGGTPAIRSSGNVSSITDNGVGLFTVNFTTAMPDANYAGIGSCSNWTGTANATSVKPSTSSATTTTTSCQILTAYETGSTGGAFDAEYVSFAVFR